MSVLLFLFVWLPLLAWVWIVIGMPPEYLFIGVPVWALCSVAGWMIGGGGK